MNDRAQRSMPGRGHYRGFRTDHGGVSGRGAHDCTAVDVKWLAGLRDRFAARVFRGAVVGLACGGAACGMSVAGTAHADDQPSVHILSAQDLCNLVWPSSQAVPDDTTFGALCVRPGGLLERLHRTWPASFEYQFQLKPGSAVELPVGSVRVDPNDPMSAWIIPDCYIPNRIDCQKPT